MKCTNCGQENPEEMKFCSLCGSLMPAAPANTSLEPENTLFIQESEIEKTSVIFCDEKFKIIDSTLALSLIHI